MAFQKGHITWNKGKKGLLRHTEEWKQKQSERVKGRVLAEETKEKISLRHTGRKMSEEQKAWISKNMKGKPGLNKGKHWKHTEEARKKKSQNSKGEKCHFWKGGITPINAKIRTSFEYKLWREAVFKRDNYQCIWGGKEHGSKLNADHIKAFSQYPELRFAIDNGRTLCHDCHKTTDNYGRKACK